MKEPEVFYTRLYLQIVNTCAVAIATGEVTFHLLSDVLSHDLASLALLIATASNVALLGLATLRANEKPDLPAADPLILAAVLQGLNELRLRSGLDPLPEQTPSESADKADTHAEQLT